MLGTTSLECAYQRVMSRIGRYETMSPKLAVQIAADRHFVFTLADEKDLAEIDHEVDKRIMDLADPLSPREIGHFIPEPVAGRPAPQSNDVALDDRGLLYVIDRHVGFDILQYEGPQ